MTPDNDTYPQDAYIGRMADFPHPIHLEDWCAACEHHATAHWDDDVAPCSVCGCPCYDQMDLPDGL